MSGDSKQIKCQTWNYLMLIFKFICSGTQPACGMLWMPGWQTKDPIPVFLNTGQGDSMLTLYLACTLFKFWSEHWSQQSCFVVLLHPSMQMLRQQSNEATSTFFYIHSTSLIH